MLRAQRAPGGWLVSKALCMWAKLHHLASDILMIVAPRRWKGEKEGPRKGVGITHSNTSPLALSLI